MLSRIQNGRVCRVKCDGVTSRYELAVMIEFNAKTACVQFIDGKKCTVPHVFLQAAKQNASSTKRFAKQLVAAQAKATAPNTTVAVQCEGQG